MNQNQQYLDKSTEQYIYIDLSKWYFEQIDICKKNITEMH